MLQVGSDRSPERAREDYIKAIYQFGEGQPVKAADLARYLGVSRVAVSKAKRLLEHEGLLERAARRTDGLRLTRHGRDRAVAMVRRHRIVETFLYRSLRVPFERLHDEAERIEHAISDDITDRLAILLGRPSHDPHGHPIPDRATPVRARATYPSLLTQPVGARIRVMSLDDRDPSALRTLATAGLLPSRFARVVASGSDGVRLQCGRRHVTVSARHATLVHVASVSRERRLG